MKHNVASIQSRVTLIMLGMWVPIARAASKHYENTKSQHKGHDAESTALKRAAYKTQVMDEAKGMLHDRAFRTENLRYYVGRLIALGASRLRRGERVPQ